VRLMKRLKLFIFEGPDFEHAPQARGTRPPDSPHAMVSGFLSVSSKLPVNSKLPAQASLRSFVLRCRSKAARVTADAERSSV
jgi:hypothetical protein